MIRFDGDFASISASIRDSQRPQELEIKLSGNPRERRIFLNGVRQRALSGLFGALKCVVFTPEDLELTKGSPDVRRSFIDLCISQIRPSYQVTFGKYENVLIQRNALLKNIASGISQPSDLDVWDLQMAKMGAYITVLKCQYTQKLDSFSKKIYSEISNNSEQMSLKYISTVYPEPESRSDWQGEMIEEYLEVLRNNRAEDIRLGFTGAGIHRDEIEVRIGGRIAKDFGSQGQNRSAAISMKLGQAYILAEEVGDMPVILLDDVLSELDSSRRDYIVNRLRGAQIFITSCERIEKMEGKKFRMKAGRLSTDSDEGV